MFCDRKYHLNNHNFNSVIQIVKIIANGLVLTIQISDKMAIQIPMYRPTCPIIGPKTILLLRISIIS
jgi:hypothetical protein